MAEAKMTKKGSGRSQPGQVERQDPIRQYFGLCSKAIGHTLNRCEQDDVTSVWVLHVG